MIKATWGNIQLTDSGIGNTDSPMDIDMYRCCGWEPEQLVENGYARIIQPVFINGAEYILHFIGRNGLNEKAFYRKGLNEFNGETGSNYPASDFGKQFTVELVTMGPTPERPATSLYNRIVKALGERDVPISGEDHLVGQVKVYSRKAKILDKVVEEFNIPVGGNIIQWLHNRTEKTPSEHNKVTLEAMAAEPTDNIYESADDLFEEVLGVKAESPAQPRNKYDREILPGVYVDVYDVLGAFKTNSAAIDHAIKKLLAPGQRGVKDRTTDLNEAISSIQREIERLGEWSECSDRATGEWGEK